MGATAMRPADLSALLGIDFSEEQLSAICAPLEPAVIIAGAGTGKTTVMAARVVWLVATGQVSSGQVLGLTFTRKAARELSQRVRDSLAKAEILDDDDDQQPVISTYDSFASSLITEYGLLIGIEPGQTLITGGTRYRLASQIVQSTADSLSALRSWQPSTVANYVLALDAELRSHLIEPEQVLAEDRAFAAELDSVKLYRGSPTQPVRKSQRTVEKRADLMALVEAYRARKKECGFTEFADQMAQAVHLLDHSSVPADLLRQRFRVVLLDEYQDTSSAQAQLLRKLFSGRSTSCGRGFPVTAVGDPFQAIYGWRGAAPSNILQFSSEFLRADGRRSEVFTLTTNRRSKPVILDLANKVAAPLRADARLLGEGVTSEQRILVAPEDAFGGQTVAVSFDTWPQEVCWIVDQILAVHQSGQVQKWSDIAVLTRTNRSIGAVFEALRSHDVPAEIVGLGGLLEVPEVADLVAVLRLIDDVRANAEVVQLLSGPRWQIGPRDLALLARRARRIARRESGASDEDWASQMAQRLEPTEQVCLMDAVEDLGDAALSAEARSRLNSFAHELLSLRRHRDDPLADLVQRVIQTTGIALELDADPDRLSAGQRQQLDRFVDVVDSYVDIDGGGGLSGLLAWFDAERQAGQGLDQAVPNEENSVKLLTVHKAKGLEWEIVFLPDMEERTFPSTLAPSNWTTQAAVMPAALRGDADWVPQLGEVSTKDLKEHYPAELKKGQRQGEDRLIYVAVTRARTSAMASCHHWSWANKTVKKPSEYFELIRSSPAATVAVEGKVSENNPLAGAEVHQPWPAPVDEARYSSLRQCADMIAQARQDSGLRCADSDADADRQARIWRSRGELLVAAELERRCPQTDLVFPASVSASALILANRDQEGFAAQILRPMPRPVSQRASVGIRFHEWLEKRFSVSRLIDDSFDDGSADDGGTDVADELFAKLCQAFENGRYALRTPVSLEEPFILTVGSQQIRGRIDAVFATAHSDEFDYQIVDWKTSNTPADPLQLSIYQLAWAQSMRIPIERVDAVFYHVLTDRIERPVIADLRSVDKLLASLTN